MFLASLKDKEKTAFLNLAYTLVASDGVFSEDELSMMEQYKQEMNLSDSLDKHQEETELSLAAFKSSPATVKKQIVFELVALAYADKDYADSEHALLEKIGRSLELDEAFLGECKTLAEDLMCLYEKIGRLVGE